MGRSVFYGTGCLVIKKSHAHNVSGAEREKEIFLIPSTFFVNNGIKMAFFLFYQASTFESGYICAAVRTPC